MNSDMAPLPGDEYQILCMKLQHAAKQFNLAKRSASLDDLRTGRVNTPYMEARALLDACIAAMGEPVVLGSEARVG